MYELLRNNQDFSVDIIKNIARWQNQIQVLWGLKVTQFGDLYLEKEYKNGNIKSNTKGDICLECENKTNFWSLWILTFHPSGLSLGIRNVNPEVLHSRNPAFPSHPEHPQVQHVRDPCKGKVLKPKLHYLMVNLLWTTEVSSEY